MDVGMKDATPSEPIPSRTRSHISDLSTLIIDRSDVSHGKQYSASFFTLVLLTSLLASCVTHFCPTVAHDSTPSLNWKTTSSNARNCLSLETSRVITECSPRNHPPPSAPLFLPVVENFHHIICAICTLYTHHIHFFYSFHMPSFSLIYISIVLVTFETWTRGQIN